MADDGFREFVEVRYAELLRTAYLLAGSTYAAEDLLQNALLRTMRRWRQVDEPMAYVRRVMVNQHITLWRRVSSREWITSLLPDRSRRDGQDAVAARDELFRALRTLPPRTRAVLVLRYWEDLTEVATAQALGCSVGAVKSQASRGLARLRTLLQQQRAADQQQRAADGAGTGRHTGPLRCAGGPRDVVTAPSPATKVGGTQ